MLCADAVSAVDDPHVSTVTRKSFDGWLAFVQILLASVELSKILVLGDVHVFVYITADANNIDELIKW